MTNQVYNVLRKKHKVDKKMQKDYFTETDFIKIFNRVLSKLQDYDVEKNMVVTTKTFLHEDLRLDSLDVMAIIIELESKYKIMTPDSMHDKIKTVGDMYKMFTYALVNQNKQNVIQKDLQNSK